MATVPEQARRRQRRRENAEQEREAGAAAVGGAQEDVVATAGQPPAASGPPPAATGRDDESLKVVHEMVRSAIDLQWKVTERIDAKVRVYVGFAITFYALVQGLVIRDDIREELGSSASEVRALALTAALLLLVTIAAGLWALGTQADKAVSRENMRALLTQAYRGDATAGAQAVNLLIGELGWRAQGNRRRTQKLQVVFAGTALTATAAILELAIAVGASV